MKIQVLGSGCATCKKLHEIAQKAVLEMGRDEEVEYITGDKGTNAIIEMGIMQSPVLAVDGIPVMTGFTPDISKIQKAICSVINEKKVSGKCGCGKGCCS
jgi:small redox-active disulfide protein 2